METNYFSDGLEKLKKLASERKSVIICVEPNPSGCHRGFISQKLERDGWTVVHLTGRETERGEQKTLSYKK